MKKVLFIVLMMALLFGVNCKREYSGIITISNIGDITIMAEVDGYEVMVYPYDSESIEITWQGGSSSQIYVYAEPLGFDDYDDAYITLYDGEEQIWETGWYYTGKSKQLQKKKK
jgi:hypothetical protein